MRRLCCRRVVVSVLALVAALLVPAAVASAQGPGQAVPRGAWQPSVVIRWNAALVEAVRRTQFRPMWTARALAIVHTAIYDAWAAYDPVATGVHWDRDLRRPLAERDQAHAEAAVSLAAYQTLVDLFPTEKAALFDPLLRDLGLAATPTTDAATSAGLGSRCAALVLAVRHVDGANQLGSAGTGPYSDYTNYLPVNTPDRLTDPNRWQPQRAADGTVQTFLTPQWGLVRPFALTSAAQFRPGPPPQYPDPRYAFEAEAVRLLSADLTDRDKAIAEYWADGPSTETPPGHWSVLAQWVSARDRHTLSQDVVMFFALGNALLDASIAVWDAKVAYDYVRPISAIRFLAAGTTIAAWGGPGLGTRLMPGEAFQSYLATPPFAEYTSGHSGFSAAAATVLTAVTRSPLFGASYTFKAGSSTVEPGLTPAVDVTLTWPTFGEAADEAGLSRRFGGIHFESGDLAARAVGTQVGRQVWQKVEQLLGGGPRRRP
ncbi:MAG: vanadium-dependent haloperoxidase [Acidobacteria bacterium]|nr:vanadium-dependent haloperoxidase [Acidobacteriota bacterium]